MCRLLGVIVNKTVEFNFSFKHFKHLGKYNQDGWGVGWYDKTGKVNLRKEGCSSVESEIYDTISTKIRSHLIIEHVRLATVGDVCDENAHPFEFKNWLFAHNGWVDHECLLKL
ncbi:MAG TPA: class II glutamine amidotransferase [Candidatus Hydrogenedens sp.]|nr:class II glutamine amidotransferase [Candidatus Hydrogenedens sp.]HOL19613.1 class II glutamine amidotransferase [Candidatus Hydrogenedens sp.]HPP59347.1 class II glutamine amidotransferase [Candidatus Hydrogenedens sp.]